MERGFAMKLSARNQIKGTVSAIKEGAVEAQVTLDVGGQKLTAVITMDAVRDLGLAEGTEAIAVIKADHVMLAVE
jgi:molybdate transport system regulatory protein